MFYLLSPDGRYGRWNRNLEEVLGLDATALARTHPRDLFAEDDKPRVDEVMATVFTEGSAQIEAGMRVASGRYVPYYLTGFRVELAGGQCRIPRAQSGHHRPLHTPHRRGLAGFQPGP